MKNQWSTGLPLVSGTLPPSTHPSTGPETQGRGRTEEEAAAQDPACRAAGRMPAGGGGGGQPYLRSSKGAPSAGRLPGVSEYFLKRTQDRPESWFLNNYERPPLPSHSTFLLHCLWLGASSAL